MKEKTPRNRRDQNISSEWTPGAGYGAGRDGSYGPKIDRQTGRIEFTDSYTEFMDTFRKDADHTSRFEEEEDQYRESKEERRQIRKRRQQRRRRIIALCTVVIAVGVIVFFVLGQMNGAYDSEKEFNKFADQKFRKMNVLPQTKDRLITYQYGDDVSFAYRYDPSTNEDLVVFRDQQVEDLKIDFANSVKKKKKETGNGKKFFQKDANYAMLFDSAVYDTGSGALAMAIYSVEYNEIDGKMKPVQTSIQTYLLDANTLRVLSPMQLLTPDYKEKAAVYSQEYLNKNYKDDEILAGADEYLKEDDSNYNQLVLSEGDMTVFFDEGTIVDASEGVVAITIPKVYLGTSVRSNIVNRYVDPDKPMVAITYDDGPGDKSEKKILECLQKYGAVATFFYLGNRIDYADYNVKKAFEIGCEIGNHSWDHADLTGLTKKQIRKEIRDTNKAIKKVIGVEPEVFRPPYGSFNERVLKTVNMPSILWTVDTMDWSSRDAKAVFKVVKKTKKLDGKIILMHSIYNSTAKATEKIVPYLQKQGYQLVTVSELIKYKTGEAPKAGHTYD